MMAYRAAGLEFAAQSCDHIEDGARYTLSGFRQRSRAA